MANILIMGSGAVGGYYGIRLAGAGNDVFLVARGEHLKALQKDGLSMESTFGSFHRKIPASENPSDFKKSPDIVIFAVKSFDTHSAMEQIRPVLGERTQILAVQNGVENFDRLVDAFGKNRVIRSFCRLGAEITSAGKIKHVRFGDIYIGEDNGSTSERISYVKGIFELAGIEIYKADDIRREVWIKFIWNSVFNVLTGLLKKTIVELYRDPAMVELMKRMANEIVAVGQADGVAISFEDAANIIASGEKLGAFRTSTYQDREKGKRLEFDAFTGAMVRLGEKHGIPTPEFRTIDAMYRVIQPSD